MPYRMMENSIAVPSAETEALSKAAKDNGIVVCIGCSERVMSGPGRGTLYNTQLTFGEYEALFQSLEGSLSVMPAEPSADLLRSLVSMHANTTASTGQKAYWRVRGGISDTTQSTAG